jgi:drug/metabolite transporter (DMT)-like permease
MTQDRTLAAAMAILVYATIVGCLDNFVRVIAGEAGLWQFHFMRGAFGIPMLVAAGYLSGTRLWPARFGGVVARSAIHGVAMLIYFGALAFLPVAQVAAGLFTAPIFVLLIARIAYGRPIRPIQAGAVAVGFLGVLLVLGPEALAGASVASLLPVAAGALYAMGNIATREWCAGESALTLLIGFFLALCIFGVAGMALLEVFPVIAPAGPDGFVLRGYVAPTRLFLFWTFMQAIGSVIGVSLMIRAYQIASAARVSVFEYMLLPSSAIWGWIVWSEVPGGLTVTGMALIAAAGIVIATASQRAREAAPG